MDGMPSHEIAEREGLRGAFIAALSCSARKPDSASCLARSAGKRSTGPFSFPLRPRASPLRGRRRYAPAFQIAPGDFGRTLRVHIPPHAQPFSSHGGMNPRVRKMAEREGFEPPDPYGSTVFKTAALNRSATSPSYSRITEIKIDVLSFAQGNRSSP